MTDRLRAAIIGAGFMGEVHARAVHAAGGVVAGVAASTPASAAAAAQRLRAERTVASAEQLVAADDVDVVHICTPNHLHARLAEQALAAGKHVVCEKPLATDVASARRVVDLAAAAGLVNAVPFVYRFYPTVRDARRRVERGETGPLRLLHGSYLQDWLSERADDNWRVDPALGGASRAFADIGVHWCDLVEFVTFHRISRVSARVATAHPQRAGRSTAVATEDVAAVLFETDHGAVGSVAISQVSPGRKNRLWFALEGADASLSFDQEAPDSLWVGGRAHNLTIARGMDDTAANRRYNLLPPGHPQGYQDCFNAFVADTYAAINGEAPAGLPTFSDGYRATVLTAAVLTSATDHTWVEVPL